MCRQTQVSSHYLVLQNRPIGDIDTIALGGDDDHGSFEDCASSQGDVSRDSQLIKLEKIWAAAKSVLVIRYVLEIISQLYNWWRRESTERRHGQGSVVN